MNDSDKSVIEKTEGLMRNPNQTIKQILKLFFETKWIKKLKRRNSPILV